MKICKYLTANYKHDPKFKFNGKEYYVHSIVRLTEKGRQYLGAKTREVILIEQFTNYNGKLCWKYLFKSANYLVTKPVDYSTDKTPNELIDEIVIPATEAYYSRETFGINSPVYKTGIKHTPYDWQIPEMCKAWMIFLLVFVGVFIFKDVGFRWMIRVDAIYLFARYRSRCIASYTTYEHLEDRAILQKKYSILYGVNHKEEN